ncbi:MAG: hypothetical protein QG649_127 [Patescibacteria group bacterium]|nr:hypothetical protein [Patescibacteria group bacterium]
MVEQSSRIDQVFAALADPIRRDILERTAGGELTVSQIAIDYDISLAAVSKHLKVLHEAGLLRRRKEGRYQFVTTNTDGMKEVAAYLQQYEQFWTERLQSIAVPGE